MKCLRQQLCPPFPAGLSGGTTKKATRQALIDRIPVVPPDEEGPVAAEAAMDGILDISPLTILRQEAVFVLRTNR